MKKILICDDEFLVRTGLESIINWNKYGFAMVGTARNGQEAIDLFNKTNPDIVLTDIRMPIIDGIELIKILKIQKPELKAFILTHYDDYKYLKEAIRLGASDYILKSELTPETLINTLCKHFKDADFKTDNTIPSMIITNEYCESLLKTAAKNDSIETTQLKKYLEVSNSHYLLFCSRFVASTKENKTNNNSRMVPQLASIRNIISKTFSNKSQVYLHQIDNKDIVGIIFICDYSTDNFDLTDTIINLKKNMRFFLNTHLRIGVSNITNCTHQFKKYFSEAIKAYQDAFFNDESYVITVNNSINNDNNSICLSRIKQMMNNCDIDALHKLVIQTTEILNKNRNIMMLEDFFNLVIIQINKILDNSKDAMSQRDIDMMINSITFDYFDNFAELKQFFDSIFSILCRSIYSDSDKNQYSPPINNAITYIQQNYQKSISLSEIAEHVGLNSSYFSTLFKNNTGINFSAYLTKYRLEQAKGLMSRTKYKNYEIAAMVGFDNPYYFSKVFKEFLGICCKDYRNSLYNNDSKSDEI